MPIKKVLAYSIFVDLYKHKRKCILGTLTFKKVYYDYPF